MSDLRVVRSTIQWIRDAFAAAARREDRNDTARLLLFDVSHLPDGAPEVPSLAQFAVERGLEDLTQAEQIEVHEAEHEKPAICHDRGQASREGDCLVLAVTKRTFGTLRFQRRRT